MRSDNLPAGVDLLPSFYQRMEDWYHRLPGGVFRYPVLLCLIRYGAEGLSRAVSLHSWVVASTLSQRHLPILFLRGLINIWTRGQHSEGSNASAGPPCGDENEMTVIKLS